MCEYSSNKKKKNKSLKNIQVRKIKALIKIKQKTKQFLIRWNLLEKILEINCETNRKRTYHTHISRNSLNRFRH